PAQGAPPPPAVPAPQPPATPATPVRFAPVESLAERGYTTVSRSLVPRTPGTLAASPPAKPVVVHTTKIIELPGRSGLVLRLEGSSLRQGSRFQSGCINIFSALLERAAELPIPSANAIRH